ncbi:multidrug effflux MFS transporter [Sphingomonas flavalba]|uniref:multidrug effflux MFS transporter n=1 Tax=Sphingomonas flavalba TaxID=2559804 RepID=UPI00109E1122|nr:multidrug effflux MFS transporter [Sphingomonas flavalba]
MTGPADTNMPPFGEFVAIVAACMAMTALSIDSMMAALPAIGEALAVEQPNTRQWVIGAFILGLGVGQIVHGPLSDRFGRRRVLRTNLVLAALFNLLAAMAQDFALLIAARVAAGFAVAACRVLAVSIVRDRFSGRHMARVVSLAYIVFMAVPILAPTVGQLILLVAEWRWIFAVLAVATFGLFLWTGLRLPETLPPDRRLVLSVPTITAGWRTVLSERMSVGYTLALALLSGALFGFINSVQQIFSDTFASPRLLGPVFAAMAGTMAVAAVLNSRFVIRLGTRRISHGALIGFIALAGLHLAIALLELETLVSFALVQALMMGCFGLASANFGAMAMEHMGGLAGTAASVQGFVATLVGGLIGIAMGQAFDGTTVPLALGFLLCGVSALAAVFVTERGRLFEPHMG